MQQRRNATKTAKANAATRRAQEAAAAPVGEDRHDYIIDTVHARGGAGIRRASTFPALQKDAPDFRAVEQATRDNSAVNSGVGGKGVPRRESTLKKAAEAQQVRKPGWRHIGRVLGAPDPARTESKRPLQLPTEVCERIIDWLWNDSRMLQRCALVCKAWAPRCRYQLQRHVVLWDRSQVQGHARRARAQPHILQQARSVTVAGAAKKGERAPIPHLGTFAMMAAAKLPLVRCLVIQNAIWRPSDFHPLIFVHLSAFSSVTTLRLLDVTFPKARDFGRLVCALPNLVRLRCQNVLFTSTDPCPITRDRNPSYARLTDLAIIWATNGGLSIVEANKVLIEHLCATGVAAGLQSLEFCVEASPGSKYLDAYRSPLRKLLKQCRWSLRNLRLSPVLRPDNGLQTDAISDIIASISDLAYYDHLETIVLRALNLEKVEYAWMSRILESNALQELHQFSIIVDRPQYAQNMERNLKRTVSALKKDVCSRLDVLFFKTREMRSHAMSTLCSGLTRIRSCRMRLSGHPCSRPRCGNFMSKESCGPVSMFPSVSSMKTSFELDFALLNASVPQSHDCPPYRAQILSAESVPSDVHHSRFYISIPFPGLLTLS